MKKLLVISLILLMIPITTIASYNSSVNLKVKSQIAEPILRIECLDNKVEKEFKKNSIEEFNFAVKNYTGDRISEIDFYYTIQIIIDNNNFPAEIELFDSKENELLAGNLKTSKIAIYKNEEEYNQYKLVVKWKDKENLDSNANISIKIDAFQEEEKI